MREPQRAPRQRDFYRDRVAAYFRARPHVWIPHRTLFPLGGECAWRTRVSDCHRELGMDIRQKNVFVRRRMGADLPPVIVRKISFRKWVPAPPALPLTEEKTGQLSFGGLL